MNKLTTGEDARSGRVLWLEFAGLLLLGFGAFELATLHSSSTSSATGDVSWRERDWFFWYNAHQLYARDPDELTEAQFDNVKQWCRCSRLVDQYTDAGLRSLTDDECTFIVETLERFCPNLQQHAFFLPVHEACCRHLEGAGGVPLENVAEHRSSEDADPRPAAPQATPTAAVPAIVGPAIIGILD